jgi:hypothetical protein
MKIMEVKERPGRGGRLRFVQSRLKAEAGTDGGLCGSRASRQNGDGVGCQQRPRPRHCRMPGRRGRFDGSCFSQSTAAGAGSIADYSERRQGRDHCGGYRKMAEHRAGAGQHARNVRGSRHFDQQLGRPADGRRDPCRCGVVAKPIRSDGSQPDAPHGGGVACHAREKNSDELFPCRAHRSSSPSRRWQSRIRYGRPSLDG